MKTWELIKLLQEEDPNNDCDICVGNNPVSHVLKLPYYYDGRLQAVVRNEDNKIAWAGYPRTQKLSIGIESIQDALFENPNLWIDTIGIEYYGSVNERYAKDLATMRKEAVDFRNEIDDFSNSNFHQKPSLKQRLGKLLHKLGVIE